MGKDPDKKHGLGWGANGTLQVSQQGSDPSYNPGTEDEVQWQV